MFRRVMPATWVFLVVAAGSAAAGPAGELSVAAGYEAGDYGTDVDSDTQTLTLRYVLGGSTGFRAEMSALRIKPQYALVRTGLGPSPGGRQNQGGGGGGGSGDGSGSGQGNGPGDGTGPIHDDWVSGVGDLRLALVQRVAGGGVKLFRLDAAAEVKVPTADEDEGLGTGEWDFRAGLSGEYRFWSVTAFGGAGWNRLGDPSWADLNDVVDLYFGLEGELFRERVTLSGWIDAHQEVVDDTGENAVIGLEARATGRRRWRVAVTGGVGTAARDYGILLGYSFALGSDSAGFRGMLR